MDTRSKSSKILSVVVALLVAASITVGALSFYPLIFERTEQRFVGIGADDSFPANLAKELWQLVYDLRREDGNKTAAEIFAPEYEAETHRLEAIYQRALAGEAVDYQILKRENVNYYNSYEIAGEDYYLQQKEDEETTELRPTFEPEPAGRPEEETEQPVNVVTKVMLNEAAMQQLAQRIFLRKEWADKLNAILNGELWMNINLDYWVKDCSSEKESKSHETIKNIFENAEQMAKYQFAAKIRMNENGRLDVLEWYNQGENHPYNKQRFKEELKNLASKARPYSWTEENPFRYEADRMQIQSPADMEIVVAVPREMHGFDGLYYNQQYWIERNLHNSGLALIYGVALGLSAVLGLCFGLVKKWKFGEGRLLRFLPAEGLVVLDVFICFCSEPLAQLAAFMGSSIQLRQLELDWMLPEGTAIIILVAANILAWAGLVLATYLSFLSFAKIFTKGLWPWLCERCWIVKIAKAIGHGVCWCWKKATEQPISEQAHKMVLGFVLFNGIVIMILCCGWFFAIPVAIIYSVVLYYLLKKKYVKTYDDYQKVLTVAQKMANGDLNAPDEADAGAYEPLRNELCQVREGFKKAVDAEVKSQSMKTELITNVSHDLKTPLTAIITYVDLLKKPDITEEERTEYIETLDKKSQRLKQLIVDLFDVSKAVSREMTPDLEELDLAALLGQVRCELNEELEKSGILFRWSVPDQKVPVLLDGARTCRIFENLIMNITKYAMPGTRAYVSLEEDGKMAIAAFKNVSAEELPENADIFTERFVRGDASRSTEGSGLGLAIAKSFAEIQGGKLELLVDGDLFTVKLTFPLYLKQQEQSTKEWDDSEANAETQEIDEQVLIPE